MRRPACAALLLALAAAALAGPAAAQTMLDQEERLIELHSLLVVLPAVQAPGALAPGQGSLGLEVIGIPVIDGTTGGKVQITASDRTRAFPRLRAALGLGEPWGLSAFAGLAYIPPIEIDKVSSNLVGVEAGLAWRHDRLAVGLRGQAVHATSKSPVTDPSTRDTLTTSAFGADLSLGWRFDLWPGGVTPYVGAGLLAVDGRFRVSSDGTELTSHTTNPAVSAGVRLLSSHHLEVVAEVVDYPDRMIHPAVRIAWVPSFWGGAPQ